MNNLLPNPRQTEPTFPYEAGYEDACDGFRPAMDDPDYMQGWLDFWREEEN